MTPASYGSFLAWKTDLFSAGNTQWIWIVEMVVTLMVLLLGVIGFSSRDIVRRFYARSRGGLSSVLGFPVRMMDKPFVLVLTGLLFFVQIIVFVLILVPTRGTLIAAFVLQVLTGMMILWGLLIVMTAISRLSRQDSSARRQRTKGSYLPLDRAAVVDEDSDDDGSDIEPAVDEDYPYYLRDESQNCVPSRRRRAC